MVRRSNKGKVSSPFFMPSSSSSAEEDSVLSYAENKGGDKNFTHRDTSSSSIDLAKLKKRLETLHPYKNYKRDELPSRERTIYDRVMQQLKVLHGTPPYEKAMQVISESFSDKKVKPGTISASLVGCSRASTENDLNGCDPRCVDSLPKDGSTGNSCNMQVFIIENGALKHHGSNVNSKSAYVFIDNPTPYTFTEEDKMLLEKHNVESFIITQVKNGVYQSSDAVLVSSLSTMKSKDIVVTTPSTAAEWWFWGIAIFLIILIIILALYMFFKAGMMKKMSANGNGVPTKQSSWVYVG